MDSFCRHTPGSGLDEASSSTIIPDHKPVPVDCSSKLQIVKNDDTPLGKPMRGAITELSPIGAVIMIKKIKHETARQILGKKIKMAFIIPAKKEKTARLKGAIMKIESHMFSDNSMFIRFDKKLSDNIVQFMGNLKKNEG